MTKGQILEVLSPYPTKVNDERKYTPEEAKLIEVGYHNCIDNLIKILDRE